MIDNILKATIVTIADVGTPAAGKPFLEIGVIITTILGLLNLGYSLRNNRRSSYVGAVTAARLKWIDELRQNLSRFVALVPQHSLFLTSNTAKRQDIFQELAHLHSLIRLQLIPSEAQRDKDLAGKVELLFQDVVLKTSPNLALLEDIVVTGQELLWEEWLKAKREAIYGDPYDTWKYRFREWCKKMDAKLNE